MKGSVVVTLMVATMRCAYAAPLILPDDVPGTAVSSFRYASPAVVVLKCRPDFPSLDLQTVAQQGHGPPIEQLRRNAEELYQATSRDAETFEAALLIPEIRLKLERALHQKLSDQMLRRLAAQAKSEAVFWYKYMQGLERRRANASPIE